MRLKMKFILLFVVGTLAGTAPARGQVLPGSGDCDAQCVTVFDVNGIVIGHGCTGGGDRGRTNCVATVEDCNTDPCSGFAVIDASGAIHEIAVCSERVRQVSAEHGIRTTEPTPNEPASAMLSDTARDQRIDQREPLNSTPHLHRHRY